MARLKGIFFDLDDTLINSTAAMQAAIEAILPLLPETTPEALIAALKRAYQELWGYPSLGYLRLQTIASETLREELTQYTLGLLGYTDTALVQTVQMRYAAAEWAALTTLPGALAALKQLRPHALLGVITNGPSRIQREKLARLELESRLDCVVADADFGAPKPDPRLFAYAGGLVGLDSSELMFVGDAPDADIAGARVAGWQSVYVGQGKCTTADFSILSLEELLTIPPIDEILAEK